MNNLNQPDNFSIEKFYTYLDTLTKEHLRLAALLEKKREAVMFYDVLSLENIMKEEQAFALISRGFNSSLESFKAELNLRGDTLSESIESLPEEWQEKFRHILIPLKEATDLVKKRNKDCQHVLEKRINDINLKMQKVNSLNIKKESPAASRVVNNIPVNKVNNSFNRSI